MSAPELPDDPRNWPTDPFALLGVERGASETDIKRAYTRLIRRFKPEHAPEQFRRIREAYEACLDQHRWFLPRPDFTPSEPDPPAPRVVRTPPTDDSPPDEPRATELPRPTAIVDEVERLWDAAVAGNEAEAYTGLVEKAAAYPDRTDLPLRLYWLLAVNPALDPARTRHDWLADALRRSRLGGAAAELYRRELEANPDAALYGSYLHLLSAECGTTDLLAVARWRLSAAGRSRSWHPLGADLDTLAKRLPFENEAGWLTYLVAALDRVAWEQPQPVSGRCRDELHRLRHLELHHAYAFDRVEETDHVVGEWWRIVNRLGAAGLFELLPHAWAGELTPAIVDPAIAAVAADPARSLWRFDQVQVMRNEARGVLGLLARALEDHYQGRVADGEEEFPPDLIRGLARGLPGGWQRAYDGLRDDLLGLLTAEAVHPLEFAAACDAHPDPRVRAAAAMLRQDLSLRLVWLACRLHAGAG